ncbi:MAG: DinB family protein [Actinomycetota bacterium]|nr:DinB family protein [Actinomycetota bacterium]
MEISELLSDAFERMREGVSHVTDGLDAAALAYRPDPDANSIAWLVWHSTRVQDDHVSQIAGRGQAWITDGWVDRFGLPLEPTDTGYDHTSEQVGAVDVDGPDLLVAYHEAVAQRTLGYLDSIDAAELDRIVDDSLDPPVSVGVRLVSVITDQLQHLGQAGYARGMLERLGPRGGPDGELTI